jgi:hypothetical protein
VALENPAPRPDNLSLFDLEIYKALATDSETLHVDFPQCPYGAASAKPTRVLYWGEDFSLLDKGKCQRKETRSGTDQHPQSRGNTHPWSTQLQMARHPLLQQQPTLQPQTKHIATIIASTKPLQLSRPLSTRDHCPSKRTCRPCSKAPSTN